MEVSCKNGSVEDLRVQSREESKERGNDPWTTAHFDYIKSLFFLSIVDYSLILFIDLRLNVLSLRFIIAWLGLANEISLSSFFSKSGFSDFDGVGIPWQSKYEKRKSCDYK